jgi:hypothetical protein
MKVLRGTVLGGIVYFFLGWAIYGILLMDFTTNNFNQCAARPNGVMIWWAIILASFILALFLTLFLKWSGAKGIIDGLKTGALFGLLMGLSMDLSNYSMSTMFNNLTALLVDVVAYTFITAIMGLVIVLTWGKEKQSE